MGPREIDPRLTELGRGEREAISGAYELQVQLLIEERDGGRAAPSFCVGVRRAFRALADGAEHARFGRCFRKAATNIVAWIRG